MRDIEIDLSPEEVKPFYKALKSFNKILYENAIEINLESGNIALTFLFILN